jgi:hypothetical protein
MNAETQRRRGRKYGEYKFQIQFLPPRSSVSSTPGSVQQRAFKSLNCLLGVSESRRSSHCSEPGMYPTAAFVTAISLAKTDVGQPVHPEIQMKMEETTPGAQLYRAMKKGYANQNRHLLRLGAAAGFAFLLVFVPWTAAHLVIWSQTPKMLILPSSIRAPASTPAVSSRPTPRPAPTADPDTIVPRQASIQTTPRIVPS